MCLPTAHKDTAIRRADFPFDPAWNIVEIFEEKVGPVCTPELALTIETRDFVAIHTRTRLDAWPRWRELTGWKLHPSQERTMDHFFLSVKAAASGLGVAIGPFSIVVGDIAAGSLGPLVGILSGKKSGTVISRVAVALLYWH